MLCYVVMALFAHLDSCYECSKLSIEDQTVHIRLLISIQLRMCHRLGSNTSET